MNLNDLHLRPLKEKDAPLMLEWLCDKDTTKNFTFAHKNFTLADTEEFISTSVSEDRFVFAVCGENDEYLGTVSITRRENIPQLAIALRKKARRISYAGSHLHLGLQGESIRDPGHGAGTAPPGPHPGAL